jgi:hypothetical protein
MSNKTKYIAKINLCSGSVYKFPFTLCNALSFYIVFFIVCGSISVQINGHLAVACHGNI